jgi:hypothetical protein
MKAHWCLLLVPLLSACATQRCPPPEPKIEYVPQRVGVPVEVRCRIEIPARPAYALDDPALVDKDLLARTAAALTGIEQRRAYEEKLEAALRTGTEQAHR